MSHAILSSRVLNVENCGEACQWLIDDLPMPPLLSASLVPTVAGLIAKEGIKGILIDETDRQTGKRRLAGLGLSIFVVDPLMDHYRSEPVPFALIDALARNTSKAGNILLRNEIAAANANGGLNLIVHYMQRGWDLSHPHWRAVGAIGHQTYIEHHVGYFLKRIYQEDWATNEEIYLMAGYTPLHQYRVAKASMPPTSPPLGDSRIAFFAERNEVCARAPGSTMSYVFERHLPHCQFSAAEQRILSLALEDLTDQEIAQRIGLSPTRIKQTWRSIYQKIADELPFLVSEEDFGDDQRRGREKRRRVLSYVSEHREEIRPFKGA